MEEIAIENRTFVHPLSDFGFKRIFMDKELLTAFLTDIVGVAITDIQYINTEISGALPSDRKAVFDLYCYTDDEEYFIVEMQVAKQVNFADRALFYSSCAIRQQAPKGARWNYRLKAVYFIGLLNFVIFPEEEASEQIFERVELWRTAVKRRFSDTLTMVFVELPKFTKSREQLKGNTDQWLYILKHLWEMSDTPSDIAKNKVFKRLFEIASLKSLKPEEMETYKKSIMDYYEVQNVAECALMEGREEGIQIGMQQGIQQGMQQGIQQGMQKGIQQGMQQGMQSVARKLAAQGRNIVEIADVTDLPIEEVKRILGY